MKTLYVGADEVRRTSKPAAYCVSERGGCCNGDGDGEVSFCRRACLRDVRVAMLRGLLLLFVEMAVSDAVLGNPVLK